MTRKGRNNVDQNASKHNYSESGSNNTSSSDIRENDQSKLGGVFKKEDIPSTTFHGKSLSSNGKKSKKTKSSANRKQNNEKEREHGSHKKSDADNFHLSSDSKTPIEKSSSGTDGSAENLRDTTHRFFDVLMGKNIGGSSLNVLKAFNVWVEKQKTQINTLTTVIHDSHDYVCVRIKIVYPILSAWILHIGKIMLLLSVLWLDCNFRGLNSLIHLGTTSFITVIWCSIFSLLAMIGITKMLIIMAMLVHPDKNMGNEKAAEAFKKIQNAYEVLLDSLKRKTYDDELRREEIMNYFRRFKNVSPKNFKHGVFGPGYGRYNQEDEGLHGESRRIACKKCNNFHVWLCTNRPKSQARRCQDCKDFHQAKDGDGWVEQSFQPVMFGLMHKMDSSHAYVCVESRIYDVTEWFICQGMRCPVNTHKPSFNVNTSLASKYNAKGASSSNGGMPMPDRDDGMTEELFEWLQNAMHSGAFTANNMQREGSSARTTPKNNGSKKRRKGKK